MSLDYIAPEKLAGFFSLETEIESDKGDLPGLKSAKVRIFAVFVCCFVPRLLVVEFKKKYFYIFIFLLIYFCYVFIYLFMGCCVCIYV